jgi:hypothetical protein
VKERKIIPQDAQGTFRLLPVSPHQLRLRVWADGILNVLLDGTALTNGQGGAPSDGWFLVNSYAPVGGSRKIFSEIVVKFPDSFPADACQATLSVQYATLPQSVQNATQLDVVLTNPLSSNCPLLPRLASRVFDDGGENSKPGGRALSQIVSRDVVFAGWLFEGNKPRADKKPLPNAGRNLPPEQSEDFHYDIFLDDDFLARNYGGATGIVPALSTALIPADHGGVPMPLLDPISTRLDVKSLSLPFLAILTVELNAWHTASRGAMPSGWVADPDPLLTGNAWPFHTTRTLGIKSGDPDLKLGDYVIVSGTLWQDELHATGGDPTLACFHAKFPGHAGWLEMHPVDSVRKVDSPVLRKHTEQRILCAENTTGAFDEFIAPRKPPDDSAILKFATLIDSRFTDSAATHSTVIEPSCPSLVHAKAAVPAGGSFKATYLLWWERGTQPRAACFTAGAPSPARQQCLQGCQAADVMCMDNADDEGPRPAQCALQLNRCKNNCPL